MCICGGWMNEYKNLLLGLASRILWQNVEKRNSHICDHKSGANVLSLVNEIKRESWCVQQKKKKTEQNKQQKERLK